MQVLVVDDDELALRMTTKVIETRGHRALGASSGHEALAIAAEHPDIDLLVLDLMMPEMDGFETLDALRASGVKAPVVVLTAKDGDDSIIEGYQAGADYYITKPFAPESLLNIVDFLIGDISAAEKRRLETLI